MIQIPSIQAVLAYLVRAGGWDYSVEAARAGIARSYVYDDRPVSRYDAIEAAEAEARSALRGLRGSPCNGNTESTRRCKPYPIGALHVAVAVPYRQPPS